VKVKGHVRQVSTKYEMLQDQLSAARSSNAQLANEVQHLQVNTAAAEKTICQLQGQRQLLDEKREQLQEQLATTNAQLNEARSQAMDFSAKASQADDRLQLLQVQVKQLEDKASHLQSCLGESSNSNTQLRSELQDVCTARTAAEASLQELRAEKQGLSSKLDELQRRLTDMAAALAGARSQQATTESLLQQQRAAGQILQEQLAASQATVAHHVAELGLLSQALSAEKATVEQLTGQQKQLVSQSEQQCAQLADQEAAIQELTDKRQQDQVTAAESLQKLQQLMADNNLLLEKCNLLDVRLEESIQLLEDREMQLQELLDEKVVSLLWCSPLLWLFLSGDRSPCCSNGDPTHEGCVPMLTA
jgi:chromosome segregation ATPase